MQTVPLEIPPRLELACLNVLWDIGSGTVKDVRSSLNQGRPLAYTTVMTVLERLVRRGIVARQKKGRSFVYAPVVERDAMRRLAVQRLLDDFFHGSVEELLAFLGYQPAVEKSRGMVAEQATPNGTGQTQGAERIEPGRLEPELL